MLASILNMSTGLSQARTVSSVKSGMQGDADTMQSEIEFDEAMTGKKDVKGRAKLSNLNDRIDAAGNMVGEKLADVNKKVSDANQAAIDGENSDATDPSEENPLLAQDTQGGAALKEPAVYDEKGQKVQPESKENWNVLA